MQHFQWEFDDIPDDEQPVVVDASEAGVQDDDEWIDGRFLGVSHKNTNLCIFD